MYGYYSTVDANSIVTYNGLPSEVAPTIETPSDFKIPSLAELLDYILGIIIYLVNVSMLGYAFIAEKLINLVINPVNSLLDNTLGLSNSYPGGENFFLQDVIFNRIDLLNVNFFNIVPSGYQMNDAAYVIRQTIAGWYTSLRNLAIGSMLIVLVYMGIRILISNIADEQAKYKEGLVNWVIGFALILIFHYILIAIVYLNETIINMIYNSQIMQTPVLATLITNALSLKASESLPSTLLYIALLYYTIKILVLYFRRMFTCMMLTIFAPVAAISYPISKMQGKEVKITSWLKQYVANVFIQSIHAIIYVGFVTVSFNIVLSYPATGALIMIVFINFMLKADKLFQQIFNINM